MNYRVNQGGLMRCCLQTLDEHMAGVTLEPEQGETLSCRFHEEQPNDEMIFDGGVWRWNREKHFPEKA